MLSRCLLILLVGLGLPLSAAADTPRVLTTIKPLQLIAAAVLEGVDEPGVLLPPGASPHTYALRPSERRALQQAERIYWVGPDMEMFLERLMAERPGARELMDIDGLTVRPLSQSHNFQQETHAHQHTHVHHHGHGHDHAAGSMDAHIWLSPDNALVIAQFMVQDLASLYPEQQAQLQSNLEQFEARVGQLDQQIRTRIEPLQDKPYFVFHDGYGYFEDHYGVAPQGVFSLSHEVQPGARHVNLLRQQLQKSGPSCVFSEPQFTPRLVDSLTQGLPVQQGELDPLGTDISVSAQGYEALLADLSERLAGCLERL